MKLFVLFFLAFALIASPTLAVDNGHIASPVAQLLMRDSLYTAIRTSKNHRSHHSHGRYRERRSHPTFEGKVKGNYEQTGGKGSYIGTFSGVTKPKKTTGDFKFDMEGSVKYMGVHSTYKSDFKGNFRVSGSGPSTKISVKARYGAKLSASFEGNILKGDVSGKVKVKLSQRGIDAKENGRFNFRIGGKSIKGKFFTSIDNKSAKVSVSGSYGGQSFFFKQSSSLNVLQLLGTGMEMNPATITRNYGTVTGTVGGQKFEQKYDQSGNQMLPAMIQ